MPRPRTVGDDELLDAAMFAFWRGGYGGVSTRTLEQATGLPASSLYHRHGSKEGLFVAALEHYLARVVEGRIQRYLQADDAFAGLRSFFTSVYRAEPRRYHACLLANTWTELGRSSRPVTAVLERGNLRLTEAFSETLRRAQAQGTVRGDLDIGIAALYLLMGLQGLLSTARGERDFDRLDAAVGLLLHSLAAKNPGTTR